MKRAIVWLFCAMSGCGTVIGFMPLNEPPHPVQARPGSEVEMFTASRPTRPFVETGLITSSKASNFSGAGDFELIGVLREEAARHGCDGVIITGENKMAQGNSASMTVNESTSGFRAACIVYR